jgi:nitrate reductase alpha subunit
MDMQINAVRMGWLPFYPQFDRNPVSLVREQEIIDWIVRQLSEKKLRFAVEEPDAPQNWPRVWFIWRGNALLTSAKGHEYFLRHYLGTASNAVAAETGPEATEEAVRNLPAPEGKFDLVIDLNFRMDSSALYSDIILPAATWYEKDDLNTTDLHTFIHPFSAAVPPSWESKSDWEIFRSVSERISDLAAAYFPEPFRDIVASPLLRMNSTVCLPASHRFTSSTRTARPRRAGSPRSRDAKKPGMRRLPR